MPQTCFVVMGFGEKTDYKTSRVLDLNKTYKHIIKKAVEAAGLVCVRADEIPHSGTIDAPMYEQLLDADLVVADLSTSNLNAAYELGIRHALKPSTTIIIAEDQFTSPFDLNHIVVRKYRHDGKALDIDVVEAFRDSLTQAIKDIMVNGRIDSPVYTFLPLSAPSRKPTLLMAAAASHATAEAAPASLSALMNDAQEAKAAGDFVTAKSLFKAARKIAPNESYVVQQLALCTYKAKLPDEATALDQARGILLELNPLHSNNAETLGLWGAVHKRLYSINKNRADLDAAVFAYEKGYRLLADHYNGINWAFLLNMRAAISEPAEAIADFILARRTRADVAAICGARLAGLKASDATLDERYWLLATMAEAALGVGNEAGAAEYLAQAARVAAHGWMTSSTQDQLQALRAYLADSPLKFVKAN